MSKMNRSFALGVLITSLTWTISLYLYWRITTDNPENINNEIKSSELPKYIKYNDNSLNEIRSSEELDKIKSKNFDNKFFNDKMQRYKKEKKFRKYSQKLIDEMKPINIGENETDEIGMIRTAEEQFLRDVGYRQHSFNTLISTKIGIYRQIPDTRNSLCSKKNYSIENLPSTSIIMCFYNEHLITLLRSIESVLKRTPKLLLKEIILVDDFSDLQDLNSKNLLKEFENVFKEEKDKIILMSNSKREGLIRSRVYGARKAKGDVLIFLDSHIEVNTGWIEPLLERIKINRTILSMPVIDIINSDTFNYSSSPLVRGGFNWGLYFKWDNLPDGAIKNPEDLLGPFKSPTMAGGLFAIDRKYFLEMGEYDMGMDVWGGENLEISFRIWQCGGSIELIPCSRVGHVFRKRRPYGSPTGGDTMIHNSLRVALVWMDDYKQYFYKQNRLARKVYYGDISERIELREKLKCQPFSWYLKNVYPEQEIPGTKTENKKLSKSQPIFEPWHSRKRNYIQNFMIKLTNSSFCLTVDSPKEKGFWKRGSYLKLGSCLRSKETVWYKTDRSELVLGQLLCLEAPNDTDRLPIINKCHEMGGDQEWKHKKTSETPIYNLAAGTCLSAKNSTKNAAVELKICSSSSLNMWDLIF